MFGVQGEFSEEQRLFEGQKLGIKVSYIIIVAFGKEYLVRPLLRVLVLIKNKFLWFL